jgi:hypothetical protein
MYANGTDAGAGAIARVVGSTVPLYVRPTDAYGNALAGSGEVMQIVVGLAFEADGADGPSALPTDLVNPEFVMESQIYRGEIRNLFPTGLYNVSVQILLPNAAPKIELGPLRLEATQFPCNASRQHVASTTEPACVCGAGFVSDSTMAWPDGTPRCELPPPCPLGTYTDAQVSPARKHTCMVRANGSELRA